MLGGLIAFYVAQAVAPTRDEELASLSVNVIAVFVFTALLYRNALLTALTIVLTFTLSAALLGQLVNLRGTGVTPSPSAPAGVS